jgi:hypothetical protein
MQGFHFPATAEAPNPRDELHSRLLAVLLRPTAVDIREDPNTETCPTCGGPGWLLTRGQVAGEEKWECRTCGGHGFLDNWPKSGNGTTTHPPSFDAGGDVPTFTSTEETDDWGEPKLLPDGRNNPNFGRMPQFKIQVPPWGTTANLTPADVVPAE